MQLTMRKVDELVPYQNNPRQNDGAVDAVANSIKEFGFKNPIIIDKNDVVVCGHTRLKAAKKLGLEEVPTIKADDLTEEQINAFRLADNKTAELAMWDETKLLSELEGIESIDMGQFGFDELTFEDEEPIFEDEVPEVDEETEPTTKEGQIFQLGEHRLMCGSSTSEKDVTKLMGNKEADMCLTDPPYNVNYGSINETGFGKERSNPRKILNDNMDDLSFYNFLLDFYKNLKQLLKAGGYFISFTLKAKDSTLELH